MSEGDEPRRPPTRLTEERRQALALRMSIGAVSAVAAANNNNNPTSSSVQNLYSRNDNVVNNNNIASTTATTGYCYNNSYY